jgi:hypothetical protein
VLAVSLGGLPVVAVHVAHAGDPRDPEGFLRERAEAADAVVMLAHNGCITGQTINVNGGVYMS